MVLISVAIACSSDDDGGDPAAIDSLDADAFVAAVDACGEGVTLEGASP